MYRLKLLVVSTAAAFWCTSLLVGRTTVASQPLPDVGQIKQRVIASEKRSASEKERYLCLVLEETDELGKQGEIKRRETKESEQFYVNGQEVQHLLKKNGMPLSEADAKKEQDRVSKKVVEYTDDKRIKKRHDEQEKQVDLFLEALNYSNGRRETHENRNALVYDLNGDANFHAANLEQKFVKALTGRIWIDEASGELLELAVATDHDVKIAGGLIASLHKGFQLHLQQSRQPDGVWLTSLVEGSGDARAGLLFHPRFRFRQTTGHCRLYSVDAASTLTPSIPK